MKNILNKFFIISTIITIAFSFNLISFATDDSSVIKIEEDVSEGSENDVYIDESEFLDDGYATEEDKPSKNVFSFSSDDVTIKDDYIAGDVFIFTSGKVSIIGSTISGNVFIFAPKIEIDENTTIYASSFLFGEDVNISGRTNCNIYSFCKKLDFNARAYIALDLFSYSQDANINGNIGRDLYIGAANPNISNDAVIVGNVNKNIIDTSKEVQKNVSNSIVDWIMSYLSYIILAIVLFILYKYTKSKIIENNEDLTKNIGKFALYGFLGLICIPIVSIILMIVGITVNIAFLLLGLYTILLFICSATLVVNLAIFIADKYSDKLNINNEILKTSIVIAVISIIYKLIQLIPVLGFLLTFASTIIGLGIIIKSKFLDK